MTYFGFLALFLGIPLVLLIILTWYDYHKNKELPLTLRAGSSWVVIPALIIIAVMYTTPWDNYLVATNVWWYDPTLVTGIVLGWVPIEEYTFFVVQTLFAGLWLLFLARRLPVQSVPFSPNNKVRGGTTLITGLIWMVSVAILVTGWRPGTYLALELVWALPPIMLQLAFGADILGHYRRLILTTILSTTLYLSFADALAISSGTWTIDPTQSMNIFLGGHLPVEEFFFFLLTNTLVTFGMVLILAHESSERIPSSLKKRFNADTWLTKYSV
jgi:lycopene cyclase domain-containing protein